MENNNGEHQEDMMQAWLCGHQLGWNNCPNEATFEVPTEYKIGPLAAEFAEGYKAGFTAAKAWTYSGKSLAEGN
jgi:hypothetical protein